MNIKTLKTALLAIGLSVVFCFSAFAAGDAVSLDDLKKQAQETQAQIDANDNYTGQGQQRQQSSNASDNGASAIGNITKSAALDKESSEATRIGSVMNNWASKLMQILGYIISIGLGLVTALDVVYIAIPPLRGILANGYAGTADQQAGGMNNGMQGGMGGGFGMGGGYGMGGGGYGMGSMQARTAMGNTANNQPAGGRTQFVTNAALNAVASASSGANPFKVYMKQQAVVLVMAPVIFVLAATGILSRVGFYIGEYITTWASGAM